MNYEPVVAGNQSNGIACIKECENAGKAREETVSGKDYILLPFLTQDSPFPSSSKDSPDAGFKPSREEEKKDAKDPENEDSKVPNTEEPRVNQEQDANVNSTNNINTGSIANCSTDTKACDDARKARMETVPGKDYILLPFLNQDPSFSSSSKDSPDARFKPSGEEKKKDAKDSQINELVRCPNTDEPRVNPEQDANVNSTNNINTVSLTVNAVDIENNDIDENIVYGCIKDGKNDSIKTSDGGRIRPVQSGTVQVEDGQLERRHVGTACVCYECACVSMRGYTQEEGIDYDEVFAPVARIEVIRLFLAYASFKDFVVYQMDVKSAFLYGKIEEEVYVCQPLGFEDPEFPEKVYKVEKALYGLHQAPRACQDMYVDEILKKFSFSIVKIASTPMETSKPLLKDAEAKYVDVHLYRSMIGSLMYLTASRPDIIYFKGQPKLGLWYPKDSPFDLEAYTDSDYAGQTIVANSTTEVEYVAASSCRGQVLWIQNQMLDYGYNFMNTKIFIDNESTICIVKNPVFHLKTKHIEIRHHFISDSYEKRLIQVIKIHIDHNVTDLLTKAFDDACNDMEMLHNNKQKLVKGQKILLNPNTHPQLLHYLILNQSLFHHNLNPKRLKNLGNPKRPTEISQSSGPIPLVADETVIKEWKDRMERVATIASSLEAEQDSGNINRTQSMATLNESLPQGTGSCSGPRCQDTILGGAEA
ncbi:putative ribonuclease H-like domain-containing protein [Tanacetum coccineum]